MNVNIFAKDVANIYLFFLCLRLKVVIPLKKEIAAPNIDLSLK